VKKIIKKISSDIEGDEELGPKLLDPIKSQGVRELADSGMIMRIKFRTRPFDQFVIRREIFSRLQKAFEKGGVQFATRQVIVHLPSESGSEPPVPHGSEERPLLSSSGKQALSAGAAAAIAQVLTEEEEAEARKAADAVEKDAEA
jgi:moderate conductance mechanosensitive channel